MVKRSIIKSLKLIYLENVNDNTDIPDINITIIRNIVKIQLANFAEFKSENSYYIQIKDAAFNDSSENEYKESFINKIKFILFDI